MKNDDEQIEKRIKKLEKLVDVLIKENRRISSELDRNRRRLATTTNKIDSHAREISSIQRTLRS